MRYSDDIGNLFNRFGGNPADYHEVAREEDIGLVRQRWPLLAALPANGQADVPAVGTSANKPLLRQETTRSQVIAPRTALSRGRDSGRLFAPGSQPKSVAPEIQPVRSAAPRFSTQPSTYRVETHEVELHAPTAAELAGAPAELGALFRRLEDVKHASVSAHLQHSESGIRP